MSNKIDRFLKLMNDRGASDLHLSVGRPPMFRDSGQMDPIRYRVLDNRDFVELMKPIAGKEWAKYKTRGDVDYSYEVPGVARFRVNMFMQERGYGAVFRIIPTKLMTFEQLGLPKTVQKFCHIRKGLILVTGPTGSGKSTTLSSIINKMNTEQSLHIITIEDPIEFVHSHKKCIVNQREIGSDTISYRDALRYVLRQDPDVVLIGEIRDFETMEATLRIAETGHLALATLHTNTAVQTIHRVLDFFPADQQEMVRTQLSFVLEGVISQQLIPRADGAGRVLGVEVLFPNAAVRNLIREEKTHQIYSQMQMGQGKHGMQTLNQSLFAHVRNNAISVEEALHRSYDGDELNQMLQNWQQEQATPANRGGKRGGGMTAAFDRRRK